MNSRPDRLLQMVADLLKSAERAAQEGRLDAAEGLCQQVLAADPRNASAKLMLGLVLNTRGDVPAAIELVAEAARLDPADMNASVMLATMLRGQGRPREAADVCLRYLSTDQGTALVHGILGLCLNDLKEIDAAVASFRSSLRLDPKFFQGHIALGNALIRARKSAEAAVAFRDALALSPNDVLALSGLGGALQELGEFDEALTCFERVLSIDPRRAWAYQKMSISKRFTKADKQLVERMEALLNGERLTYTDARALHYALGKVYDDLGEYEKALQNVDAAAQITVQYERERDPFDAATY